MAVLPLYSDRGLRALTSNNEDERLAHQMLLRPATTHAVHACIPPPVGAVALPVPLLPVGGLGRLRASGDLDVLLQDALKSFPWNPDDAEFTSWFHGVCAVPASDGKLPLASTAARAMAAGHFSAVIAHCVVVMREAGAWAADLAETYVERLTREMCEELRASALPSDAVARAWAYWEALANAQLPTYVSRAHVRMQVPSGGLDGMPDPSTSRQVLQLMPEAIIAGSKIVDAWSCAERGQESSLAQAAQAMVRAVRRICGMSSHIAAQLLANASSRPTKALSMGNVHSDFALAIVMPAEEAKKAAMQFWDGVVQPAFMPMTLHSCTYLLQRLRGAAARASAGLALWDPLLDEQDAASAESTELDWSLASCLRDAPGAPPTAAGVPLPVPASGKLLPQHREVVYEDLWPLEEEDLAPLGVQVGMEEDEPVMVGDARALCSRLPVPPGGHRVLLRDNAGAAALVFNRDADTSELQLLSWHAVGIMGAAATVAGAREPALALLDDDMCELSACIAADEAALARAVQQNDARMARLASAVLSSGELSAEAGVAPELLPDLASVLSSLGAAKRAGLPEHAAASSAGVGQAALAQRAPDPIDQVIQAFNAHLGGPTQACTGSRDAYGVVHYPVRDRAWEAAVEARWQALKHWKLVYAAASRGFKSKRPDFNRKRAVNAAMMPASWLIPASGRPTAQEHDAPAAGGHAGGDVAAPLGGGGHVEDDLVCQVCFDGMCGDHNQIHICDACTLAVHQHCYGVLHQPAAHEPWLCDVCATTRQTAGLASITASGAVRFPAVWTCSDTAAELAARAELGLAATGPAIGCPAVSCLTPFDTTCALCAGSGGAFKPTTDGRWVHVQCALLTGGCWPVHPLCMSPWEIRPRHAAIMAYFSRSSSFQQWLLRHGKGMCRPDALQLKLHPSVPRSVLNQTNCAGLGMGALHGTMFDCAAQPSAAKSTQRSESSIAAMRVRMRNYAYLGSAKANVTALVDEGRRQYTVVPGLSAPSASSKTHSNSSPFVRDATSEAISELRARYKRTLAGQPDVLRLPFLALPEWVPDCPAPPGHSVMPLRVRFVLPGLPVVPSWVAHTRAELSRKMGLVRAPAAPGAEVHAGQKRARSFDHNSDASQCGADEPVVLAEPQHVSRKPAASAGTSKFVTTALGRAAAAHVLALVSPHISPETAVAIAYGLAATDCAAPGSVDVLHEAQCSDAAYCKPVSPAQALLHAGAQPVEDAEHDCLRVMLPLAVPVQDASSHAVHPSLLVEVPGWALTSSTSNTSSSVQPDRYSMVPQHLQPSCQLCGSSLGRRVQLARSFWCHPGCAWHAGVSIQINPADSAALAGAANGISVTTVGQADELHGQPEVLYTESEQPPAFLSMMQVSGIASGVYAAKRVRPQEDLNGLLPALIGLAMAPGIGSACNTAQRKLRNEYRHRPSNLRPPLGWFITWASGVLSKPPTVSPQAAAVPLGSPAPSAGAVAGFLGPLLCDICPDSSRSAGTRAAPKQGSAAQPAAAAPAPSLSRPASSGAAAAAAAAASSRADSSGDGVPLLPELPEDSPSSRAHSDRTTSQAGTDSNSHDASSTSQPLIRFSSRPPSASTHPRSASARAKRTPAAAAAVPAAAASARSAAAPHVGDKRGRAESYSSMRERSDASPAHAQPTSQLNVHLRELHHSGMPLASMAWEEHPAPSDPAYLRARATHVPSVVSEYTALPPAAQSSVAIWKMLQADKKAVRQCILRCTDAMASVHLAHPSMSSLLMSTTLERRVITALLRLRAASASGCRQAKEPPLSMEHGTCRVGSLHSSLSPFGAGAVAQLPVPCVCSVCHDPTRLADLVCNGCGVAVHTSCLGMEASQFDTMKTPTALPAGSSSVEDIGAVFTAERMRNLLAADPMDRILHRGQLPTGVTIAGGGMRSPEVATCEFLERALGSEMLCDWLSATLLLEGGIRVQEPRQAAHVDSTGHLDYSIRTRVLRALSGWMENNNTFRRQADSMRRLAKQLWQSGNINQRVTRGARGASRRRGGQAASAASAASSTEANAVSPTDLMFWRPPGASDGGELVPELQRSCSAFQVREDTVHVLSDSQANATAKAQACVHRLPGQSGYGMVPSVATSRFQPPVEFLCDGCVIATRMATSAYTGKDAAPRKVLWHLLSVLRQALVLLESEQLPVNIIVQQLSAELTNMLLGLQTMPPLGCGPASQLGWKSVPLWILAVHMRPIPVRPDTPALSMVPLRVENGFQLYRAVLSPRVFSLANTLPYEHAGWLSQQVVDVALLLRAMAPTCRLCGFKGGFLRMVTTLGDAAQQGAALDARQRWWNEVEQPLISVLQPAAKAADGMLRQLLREYACVPADLLGSLQMPMSEMSVIARAAGWSADSSSRPPLLPASAACYLAAVALPEITFAHVSCCHALHRMKYDAPAHKAGLNFESVRDADMGHECAVCKRAAGYTLPCAAPGCTSRSHPTCAAAVGWYVGRCSAEPSKLLVGCARHHPVGLEQDAKTGEWAEAAPVGALQGSQRPPGRKLRRAEPMQVFDGPVYSRMQPSGGEARHSTNELPGEASEDGSVYLMPSSDTERSMMSTPAAAVPSVPHSRSLSDVRPTPVPASAPASASSAVSPCQSEALSGRSPRTTLQHDTTPGASSTSTTRTTGSSRAARILARAAHYSRQLGISSTVAPFFK